MNTTRMPLLFVGHGNPMNAITDNTFSLTWEKIGKDLPTPRAIVCLSAHWLTQGAFVTSSAHPEIIHDFYGFPKELYEVQYPAKGDEHTARNISQCSSEIKPDNKWGIDHGAWSVLKRMFPKANIPVVQISIDYSHPPHAQFEIMKKLKDLRDKGVLFVGSGNIVHNLRLAAMDKTYDWAVEFEAKSKRLVERGDIQGLIDHRKWGTISQLAIPTDDHYRPMLNTLALKHDDEEPVFFNEGIDMASVSMLSFIYR